MAILIPQRRRDVRLDIALVYAGRLELALDHQVGLGKASSTSPFSKCRCTETLLGLVPILTHRVGEVRRRAQRCASSAIASSTQVTLGSGSYSTRISFSRFFGDVRARGRHGRHGVALVQRLVMRQAVGAQVGQVHRAFAQVGHLVFQVRKVGAP